MTARLLSSILILCVAAGPAAGTPSPATPIVNGFEGIAPEDYGLVQVGGCSGTLIAPRWVLTAKHCIPEPKIGRPWELTLRMGSSTTTAERIVIHPNLDVALVRIKALWTTNAGFYMELYQGPRSALAGKAVILAGFGNNAWSGGGAGVLRFSVNTIAGLDRVWLDIPVNALGQGATNGDSGGPAIGYSPGQGAWTVVGVANTAGPGGANYVSTTYFRRWAEVIMAQEHYGAAVASGDFNGDGYTDLAVGAPRDAAPALWGTTVDSGTVSVWLGGASGYSHAQTLDQSSLETNQTNDHFGLALAAGDIDADGHDDLAVGAPYDRTNGEMTGAVFVFRGSPSGLVPESFLDQADTDGEHFGWAVAFGDFDGDGRDDLAVGAPMRYGYAPGWPTGGGSFTRRVGAVYVYRTVGTGSALAQVQLLNQVGLHSQDLNDMLGYSLVAADFDGSGEDDLAVGAPGERGLISGAYTQTGAVYLYRGGAGAAPLADWKQLVQPASEANEYGDLFGWSLGAGHFMQGLFEPSRPDLAVGAPGDRLPGSIPWDRTGSVHVFSGGSLSHRTVLRQTGLGADEDGDWFGASLATLGGGTAGALAVGAPGEQPGSGPRAGHVFVFDTVGSIGLYGLDPSYHFYLSTFGLTSLDGDLQGTVLASHQGSQGWHLVVGLPGDADGLVFSVVHGSGSASFERYFWN